jgi:hypothetical protein
MAEVWWEYTRFDQSVPSRSGHPFARNHALGLEGDEGLGRDGSPVDPQQILLKSINGIVFDFIGTLPGIRDRYDQPDASGFDGQRIGAPQGS